MVSKDVDELGPELKARCFSATARQALADCVVPVGPFLRECFFTAMKHAKHWRYVFITMALSRNHLETMWKRSLLGPNTQEFLLCSII